MLTRSTCRTGGAGTLASFVRNIGLTLIAGVCLVLQPSAVQSQDSKQSLSTPEISFLAQARAYKARAAELDQQGRDANRDTTIVEAAQAWEQAAQAYERAGVFGEAAVSWTEAARLFQEQGMKAEQSQALMHLAQTLQQNGQYRRAMMTLQVAQRLAEGSGSRELSATILGLRGRAAHALGFDVAALEAFEKSLRLARESHVVNLVAITANDMGTVLASQGRAAEARQLFIESATLASEAAMSNLAATALVNAGRASIDEAQYGNAVESLDQAAKTIAVLPDSHDKAMALINLALAYEDVRQAFMPKQVLVKAEPESKQAPKGARGVVVEPGAVPKPPTPLLAEPAAKTGPAMLLSVQDLRQRAVEALQQAQRVALGIADARAESYALGYIGQIREGEGRLEEALELTRGALFAAQRAKAPESLYRWQWQTGRLLRAMGKEEAALASYRQAAATLQPIRHEFLVGPQDARHSFRESVGPLFFQLADLLLRRAATTDDMQAQQTYLVQVRDTTESFKAAELQDYFRDECVRLAKSQVAGAAQLPQTVAVIYPIMLPDRLELLVAFTEGLKRYSVSVDANTLTEEVRAFRRAVQNRKSDKYLAPAQQLYTRLIKPLEAEFERRGIDTIVFVPDGPLRTIPISALHDGHDFLIVKYALAVTPGMDLTDLRPMKRKDISLLSVGLTESVQGFPALPYVADELKTVRGIYPSKTLIDTDFKVPRVEKELRDHQYGIVHIASHGKVENDVRKSFLLAYDDKITMDQLSHFVGLNRFEKGSLELLTLSACETAVGDDRAALGLAGMAVKAGARSAVATLWFIDDQATADLVAEFYRQLKDPTISKAVALQRAQLKIGSEPGHEHPSYWSPFLLINNWL